MGRGYLRLIDQWRAAGYFVQLVYLQLDDPQEVIARVAERVMQGGHDIPEAVIRRRFAQGRRNFEQLYAPRVDAWLRYDNSGDQPVLIDWSNNV